MEHEERKIAKVYAVVALYTIILLVVGISLGIAVAGSPPYPKGKYNNPILSK